LRLGPANLISSFSAALERIAGFALAPQAISARLLAAQP